MNHSRRAALKVVVAVSGVSLATSGCQANSVVDRKLLFASLDDALAEAVRLASVKSLNPGTIWTLPQTLVHLAQSIEYSVSGFPEHRSELFQRTIGSAAFSVFSWRGRMTHSLAEAIPGAPSLNGESDLAVALARLQGAVQEFKSQTTALQPHFAYGQLDKSQYEQAHSMHLADHFSVIDA